MGPVTFIASSAAEALARISVELGPEAVVLSVRELPGRSWSRWWKKSRIEVIAQLPPASDQELALAEERLDEALETIRLLSRQLPAVECEIDTPRTVERLFSSTEGDLWLDEELVEWGLALEHVQRVRDRMEAVPSRGRGDKGGCELVRDILRSWWSPCGTPESGGRHVFIGGPGAGKTTVLSKWMAQSVLLEEKTVRVWRLDGQNANTAEGLTVCAEVLGIPVERMWRGTEGETDVEFVDVPGSDWRDPAAMDELEKRLEELSGGQVHLVLNAAYEGPLLREQIEAYSRFQPTDLIFTHMDEETRWGKLWNCVLETNCSIRLLGFGQNGPGTLRPAEVSQLLPFKNH